jgi:inner membrane protein
MTAPNHIAGGIFFTAFFASLWSINIFSSINLLAVTIIGTLLPDIDHTKSLIGKAVYPLARWLDRRFGHRTITHNLFFLIAVCISGYFTVKILNLNTAYNVILFFSVFSHFLLDMITLQGIPLFYPLLKNPCVIPGSPAMRMEGGKPTTETIAFIIFCAASLTCWDLFSNGFWTSYNRLFGSISHVYYEFKSSNQFIDVEYDYFSNTHQHKGKTLLLYASEEKLILYENHNITELSIKNNYQKINKVVASKTKHPYIEQKLIFINIKTDSLNNILSQNLITGEIQSNHQFSINQDNITTTTKSIRFERQFSPFIITTTSADTTNTDEKNKKNDKKNNLKIKQLQNQEADLEYQHKLQQYNNLINSEKTLSDSLKNLPAGYLRNKIETELITLKKKISAQTKPEPPINIVKQEEIKILEKEIKQETKNKPNQNQTFSGYITYPVIPESYL